ncbi:Sodium-transporting two-sector ATPase [candidate division TM7 genomosp. GTL1]|nr:Sodium-transporting two-sector ATPase [candidate division TM7 genomosp. GTL1]
MTLATRNVCWKTRRNCQRSLPVRSEFQKLVAAGNPTGEVVGLDRFLLTVKGLDGIAVGAMVLFESGQRGMVRDVNAETALVLNLEAETTPLGTLAVLQDNIPTTRVGEGLIGRIVTPLCRPLDDKGTVRLDDTRPLFYEAPSIMERTMLSEQLPSGVTAVDALFPIVLGQRIAILGDTKAGKSTFLGQLGVNQIDTGRIVVYVLIGKRRVEIDRLVATLNQTGAIKHSIVVVANIFDSIAQSYIAPYVGCAIAEHLWYGGRDVIVVYDDLTSHAKVYREISLLSEANPGRDSYPGDMFYAHSSLLERAGKLASSGKTLTALPALVTPGDDITAYLPTSIMSITDGQIIFDLATFRQNIRPAVNTGLSVSRVGGRVQTKRQKEIAGGLFKSLVAYRQAQEFSHFGSEVAPDTERSLRLGRLIYDALRQPPAELYSLIEQQILLEVVLKSGGSRTLDMVKLKKSIRETAAGLTIADEDQVQGTVAGLLEQSTIEVLV